MRFVSDQKPLVTALALLCVGVATLHAQSPRLSHMLVGELKKVDAAARTITVKTAEGTEETLKYTGKTAVRGLERVGTELERGMKDAGGASALVGKEGAHVLVHYTVQGNEKTATLVKHAAHGALKTIEGTLVRVDTATGVVVIKSKGGAVETYDLAKDATIDTERGIVKAGEFTAREGDHITVHYIETGGRNVIHALKKLGRGVAG